MTAPVVILCPLCSSTWDSMEKAAVCLESHRPKPKKKPVGPRARKRRGARTTYFRPRQHPEAPYLVYIDGKRHEVWTLEESKRLPKETEKAAEAEGCEVSVSVYRLRKPMAADDRRRDNKGGRRL